MQDLIEELQIVLLTMLQAHQGQEESSTWAAAQEQEQEEPLQERAWEAGQCASYVQTEGLSLIVLLDFE